MLLAVDIDDPWPGVMLRGRIVHKDCPNQPEDLWLCEEQLIHDSYEDVGWLRMRTVTAYIRCWGCNEWTIGTLKEWAPEQRS